METTAAESIDWERKADTLFRCLASVRESLREHQQRMDHQIEDALEQFVKRDALPPAPPPPAPEAADDEEANELAIDLSIELAAMTAENERLKLRLLSAAGDDLCRLSQEEIKELSSGGVKIPPREEFIASCERFHAQIAGEVGVLGNCLTLAQLIAENAKLTAERDAARNEINSAWQIIDTCYEIEPREVFEAGDKATPGMTPLSNAVFTIWKREPKVKELTAERDQLREQLTEAEPFAHAGRYMMTAMDAISEPELTADVKSIDAYIRVYERLRAQLTAAEAACDVKDAAIRAIETNQSCPCCGKWELNLVNAATSISGNSLLEERERLRAAIENLCGIIEAHEIDTLDCDRRGEIHCDCLERAMEKARAALKGGQ